MMWYAAVQGLTEKLEEYTEIIERPRKGNTESEACLGTLEKKTTQIERAHRTEAALPYVKGSVQELYTKAEPM